MNWKVFRSMKNRKDVKDFAYFVHLEEPQYAWFHRPELVAVIGGQPPVPTSEWDKDQRIPTGEVVLSDDIAAGTYNVLVGLWDPDGDKQRAPILGLTPDNSRTKLGRLTIEKRADKIVKMTFEPEAEDASELFERLLPNEKPLNASAFQTNGGYRQVVKNGETTITPLPGEPAFEVNARCEKPTAVIAVDANGKTLREVPFTFEENRRLVTFTTQAGEFSYVVK